MAETAKQKWNGQSRGGTFGTWCFVMLVRHAGLGAAYALLALVVPYFVVFAPRATRATWRFCRKIRRLGVWRSVVEIFGTYYAFGQCIIDKIAIGQGLSAQYHYEIEGEEEIDGLFEDGDKGECVAAIFVGGHIGSWECGAPFFARFGKRMNVTIFNNEHEEIESVIERESQGRSFNLIPLKRDWLESIMEIKGALDRGEFVCFMGDRYMTGSPTRVLDFMGHKARFTNGPFDVCSALRVPMAFFFVMRESGRRYRIFFKVLKNESGRRTDAKALQSAFVEQLERMVLRYPRQWFNFYDYFDIEN